MADATCARPRSGSVIVTILSALVVLIGVGADVLARDGRSSRAGGYGDFEREMREAARRQQAEMERQRREQEQEQKRQMREMEAQARKGSNGWGQDNGWGKSNNNGWGNQGNQWQQPVRAPTPTVTKSPSSQDRAPSKENAQARKEDGQDGKSKTAEDARDDDATTEADDDWNLTDAERRVRAIGRATRQDIVKAQRQNDELRHKEQARDARIRERSLRLQRREEAVKAVTRLPPAPPAKPSPIVPAVAADKSPQPTKAVQRRTKILEGLQSQASHLGMRNDRDGKTADDPRKGSVADGEASAPDSAKNAEGSSSPEAPAGGEMPAAATGAPQGTLVVSGLTPTELDAAKAKGFAVSEDIDLKGSGAKVRRVSAQGFTDEELERELHKMAPFSQTVPNHEYSIYLGTIGEGETASRAVTQASSQPCPQKTCFGSQLIKWTSTLAACTKNVKIGIIDTSFDTGHPAFKQMKPIQGEFLGDERPSPYDWHGTAVLSVLAGDPHSGTPGLVPDATFMLATAFRSDANGNATTDTVNLLRALDWLDQLDVDIVNMSFSGPKDEALAKAIARMSKKGIVFIAAAGNMGPTAAPSYPAAYPNVIAVTAINRKGVSYKSANRGSYIDVSAPGVDILTALPDAKQGYRTGTSFAVPFVTAILATKVGERSQWAGRSVDPLDHVPKRDLGPPGQDPIYGAGLALAPPRCAAGNERIAQDASPIFGAWSTETTSANTTSKDALPAETTSTETASPETAPMDPAAAFIKAGVAFGP